METAYLVSVSSLDKGSNFSRSWPSSRASWSAKRCDALWGEADPKSEVVATGLLEMGAPSVTVPEVGVNIGGSIADADAGVCSISDEEGVLLATSLDVNILFACMVEGENQLGGACRRLTLIDQSILVLRGD